MMDVYKRSLMQKTQIIVVTSQHHRTLCIVQGQCHQKFYSIQGGRNNKSFVKNLINLLCHNFGLFARKSLYQSSYKLMDGGNKNLCTLFYMEWSILHMIMAILFVYMELWKMHINSMALLIVIVIILINIKLVIVANVYCVIVKIYQYIIFVRISIRKVFV